MDTLLFSTGVNDGQNHPVFQIDVETKTGQVIALIIRDREDRSIIHARIHIPDSAATGLGSALSLAGQMKMMEMGMGSG